MLLTTIVHLLT